MSPASSPGSTGFPRGRALPRIVLRSIGTSRVRRHRRSRTRTRFPRGAGCSFGVRSVSGRFDGLRRSRPRDRGPWRARFAHALIVPNQRPNRNVTETTPLRHIVSSASVTSIAARISLSLLWFRSESENDPARTSRGESCRGATPRFAVLRSAPLLPSRRTSRCTVREGSLPAELIPAGRLGGRREQWRPPCTPGTEAETSPAECPSAVHHFDQQSRAVASVPVLRGVQGARPYVLVEAV